MTKEKLCNKEPRSIVITDSRGRRYRSYIANRRGDALATFAIINGKDSDCKCIKPKGHHGRHHAIKSTANGIVNLEWSYSKRYS